MADTLTAVGPGAPTLLEGWTTTELAAHLASLESAGGVPLFIGRQLITRVHPRPTKGSRKMAARALERAQTRGYSWTVDRVRSPHRLPTRLGGGAVAMFEIYVHHQDVLRADPARGPRPPPPGLAVCLPWLLTFHAKRLAGIELVAVTDDGEHRSGSGSPVTVSGGVGEVVLWLAGRGPASTAQVDAADDTLLERVDPVTRI